MADKNFDKRLDVYTYKDSLFTFSVNPILGIDYFSNDSGSFYHRWNGAEAFAYIGKHWGFYASLRDNHESILLEKEDFLTQRTGANYKYADGAIAAASTAGNDFALSPLEDGIAFWIKPTSLASIHAQESGSQIVNWANTAGSASAARPAPAAA